MINDILNAVMARLNEKEPNLKYMDEDWGQLDYYQENIPVKFPACLLELQQTSWKNQSQKVQDGILTISIRVADLKLSNTNFKAPSAQKTKAAAIWIVIENIHKALHGWRPLDSEFGTLTRISTRRIKRDDGIREFELLYSALCTDASAMTQQYGSAEPELSIEL